MMDTLIEDVTLYRITIALVILFSLVVCRALNSQRITAERAFWGVWIFLVVSAETVTSFDFFEYPYAIDVVTRQYTLELFLTSAIAFISASLVVALKNKRLRVEKSATSIAQNWRKLTERRKLIISIAFFVIGTTELVLVIKEGRYANLLDLRLASLEDVHTGFRIFLYIFYLAHAYILLLGYIDGNLNRISIIPVILVVASLVVHNLSTGSRINIIVAPLFYITSYMLSINTRQKNGQTAYKYARRKFVIAMAYGFLFFSFIGLIRTAVIDFTSIASIEGFINKVVFVVPKYITDAYVSISVHAGHALTAGPQYGKFTFDAIYRLLVQLNMVERIDPNIFGHLFYRETPEPWAWTQTNVIPRLIADYGKYFYLVVYFFVAFISQWLTIMMVERGFIRHSIATMAVICSLYTIQAAMWFSAFTTIILFFCVLLDISFFRSTKVNMSYKVKSLQRIEQF
jgi:oligosaccharide repeat unit polymerase